MRTLLLYDGKMSSAERIAYKLCYLIGNTYVTDITEAPKDLSGYDSFCLVFNFYGTLTAGRTKNFLADHKEELKGKKIALVGIGFSDLGFARYSVDMQAIVGTGDIEPVFVADERQAVRAGFEIAKSLHVVKGKLEQKDLEARIEAYIADHNTLALATASEGFVRCTPLEYMYRDNCFYIITEGGKKFRGIFDNGNVSMAIFDSYSDMDSVKGLQIYGSAAVVAIDSDEYLEIMAAKGMKREQLAKLPVTMFVIKIKPLQFELTDASLKSEGFDTHQMMNTEFQIENWKAGAAFAKNEEKRLEDLQKAAREISDPEKDEEIEEEVSVEEPAEPAVFRIDDYDEEEEEKPGLLSGKRNRRKAEEKDEDGFDFGDDDENEDTDETPEEEEIAEEESFEEFEDDEEDGDTIATFRFEDGKVTKRHAFRPFGEEPESVEEEAEAEAEAEA
ncbi:MAG: pyridoxamine 5'-phosphate oxidase family protein, partial [Lachnospiraceae bacterium]|nr:pyridoxamine 5'-phosphate oxidase family protein [Lachnospiraceae bacterium]